MVKVLSGTEIITLLGLDLVYYAKRVLEVHDLHEGSINVAVVCRNALKL